MINFLVIIGVTIPAIFGVYAAFRYKYNLVDKRLEDVMILGRVAYWLDGFLPEIIRKPLYGCPPCMSTVWTPIMWFVIFQFPFDIKIIAAWLVVSGINWLIVHNLEV